MAKIGVLVAIAVAAVAVWFFLLRAKDPTSIAADRAGSGSAATAAGSASAPATNRAKPVDRVGRISPEERKRLADQIAKARANRPAGAGAIGTAGGTPPPELPDNGDAKLVRTTMKEAMREIIPFLADCYDKAGDKVPGEIKVVANMTLTGDPDIGTIIDTNGVLDGDGKPLEASFDACLMDAFVSLQMPPLSEGSEVKVTYPFVFARNGPDEPAGSGTLPP